MSTKTPIATPATALPVPALSTYALLSCRPIRGGADVPVKLSADRAALRAEAAAANRDGHQFDTTFVVEDCVPLVIRQAGTQFYMRGGSLRAAPNRPLRVFLSEQGAGLAAVDAKEDGVAVVIEPLTEQVAARYPALEMSR
jgi:hypothetical protein